jgi:pantoate--beta-alanine ligase
MEVVNSVERMREISRDLRRKAKEVGLVPTMGAFHEGHLSLIREARRRDEVVVVSLFVNPLQFGPSEDYEQYPRDLERDVALASCLGVDFLFAPSAEEIYPQRFDTYVTVEGLSGKLCGISRPGHFRGVTTVVAKLFNLILPRRAYFGQKDAQQAIIVGKMIRDLDWDIELVMLPTVREEDGLAMSSRNLYLSQQERQEATVLYRSLCWAAERIKAGEKEAGGIREGIREMICSMPSARIDYISVVDPETLEEIERIEGKVLVALAVWFGRARLIDNLIIAP